MKCKGKKERRNEDIGIHMQKSAQTDQREPLIFTIYLVYMCTITSKLSRPHRKKNDNAYS
jgi:hypothetical protein